MCWRPYVLPWLPNNLSQQNHISTIKKNPMWFVCFQVTNKPHQSLLGSGPRPFCLVRTRVQLTPFTPVQTNRTNRAKQTRVCFNQTEQVRWESTNSCLILTIQANDSETESTWIFWVWGLVFFYFYPKNGLVWKPELLPPLLFIESKFTPPPSSKPQSVIRLTT